MRSFVTAVVAALEAAAVALAGLVVVAAPALLLWIVTFGLAAEPAAVASWAAGVWLLGHFVPLGFEIPPEAALGLGLPPEALGITISLAPLGITLLTVSLALRAGWRFAGRGGTGAAGALGGAAGFGVVAFLVSMVAAPVLAWPTWAATLVPALVYGISSLSAFLVRAARDGQDWWQALVRRTLRGLDRAGLPSAAALPARAAQTVRLAAASLALYVGIAALALTIALVAGYASVIELSQNLQLDPLGSILLFLAQLVILPVGVVWAGAWATGAGFSVGIGSSVTPFETLTGPLPALPVLGAIPQGWGALGAIPPALLVVAGIAVGAAFARRPEFRRASWAAACIVPVLAAALAGLAVAGLTFLGSGSIGPDRLAEVGAHPWLVGGLAAGELGLGLLVGTVASRFDAARIRESLPREVPGGESLTRLRERVGDRVGEFTRGRGAGAAGAAAVAGLGSAPAPDTDDQETADLSELRVRDADPDTDDGFDYGSGSSVPAQAAAETPEQETVPLDDAVSGVGEDPDPDPETEPGPEPDSGAADDAAADSETEAILQAYAWDGAQEVSPERDEDRGGWRRPWRGR